MSWNDKKDTSLESRAKGIPGPAGGSKGESKGFSVRSGFRQDQSSISDRSLKDQSIY